METRRPYRIVVFAQGFRPVGKPRKNGFQRIERAGFAYMGWQETQHYQEARLPNAGSFLYPGIFAVRRAAIEYLALPSVHQVQVRTDQDRSVYLFNKHADGTVTGYRPDGCLEA